MPETNSNFIQVGRNCLADFLGGADPHAAASMAEILAEAGYIAGACTDDDEGGLGGGSRFYFTTADYLPWVAQTIRINGWLPKGKAWERDGHTHNASAVIAWNNMVDYGRPMSRIEKYTDADAKVADDAIAFCAKHFEDVDTATLGDYEHNLRVSLSTGIVEFRTAGMIASCVSFAAREQAKRNPVIFTNEFVGELGKRGTYTLTFLRQYKIGRAHV